MLEQIQIEYKNSIKVIDNIKNINELVKKVLGEAIKSENIPYNFFLLIVFSSPDKIKDKNNEYRNINETTDVLSFPSFSKSEINNIIKYSTKKNKEHYIEIPRDVKPYLEGEWSLGEIHINLEKIEEQAMEYNHSVTRELAYILIHGFYHLLGEDHIKSMDKGIMREKEDNILKNLGILRGSE